MRQATLQPPGFVLYLTLAATPASAVTLQFDYSLDSNGFFSDSARRTVLQAAGDFFSNLLTDSLTAITSGPSGFGFNNTFNGVIIDPANSNNQLTLNNLSIAANTLVIYAGGSSFTGNTLGVGGFGGFSASGTQGFFDNIRQRGQVGATTGAHAVEFAPWGGSISFNLASNWYFDSDTSTNEAFAGFDFYSVALHELGHVLGFGLADSWDARVNAGLFTGSASTASHGSAVPLSTDLSHWANGLTSTLGGAAQETAMDPDIAAGQRKRFTVLDQAALTDIGWTLAAAPPAPTTVPIPAGLLAALALGLAFRGSQADRSSALWFCRSAFRPTGRATVMSA